MTIWRLLLFLAAKVAPYPSLPIFVPRVSNLHTLGQFPTRLNSFRLVSVSPLSLCISPSPSPFLPPSLPPSSDVPRNPFSCQWRQKRGSAQKNGRLPSPTTNAFPGKTALKTCLLWTWHTTSFGVVADMFFFAHAYSLKWLTEAEDASIRIRESARSWS